MSSVDSLRGEFRQLLRELHRKRIQQAMMTLGVTSTEDLALGMPQSAGDAPEGNDDDDGAERGRGREDGGEVEGGTGGGEEGARGRGGGGDEGIEMTDLICTNIDEDCFQMQFTAGGGQQSPNFATISKISNSSDYVGRGGEGGVDEDEGDERNEREEAKRNAKRHNDDEAIGDQHSLPTSVNSQGK